MSLLIFYLSYLLGILGMLQITDLSNPTPHWLEATDTKHLSFFGPSVPCFEHCQDIDTEIVSQNFWRSFSGFCVNRVDHTLTCASFCCAVLSLVHSHQSAETTQEQEEQKWKNIAAQCDQTLLWLFLLSLLPFFGVCLQNKKGRQNTWRFERKRLTEPKTGTSERKRKQLFWGSVLWQSFGFEVPVANWGIFSFNSHHRKVPKQCV